MRWISHGERTLYHSPWLAVGVADVELPDGRRFEHHLVRIRPAAGVAAVDGAGRVLLIWRHRFIPDSWGWEIPGGRVEPGEDPAETAARESVEETGWRPGTLRPLMVLRPAPGLTDGVHHIFEADGAVRIGEPTDVEAERVEWMPLARVPELIAQGRIGSASTAAALLLLLTRRQSAAGATGEASATTPPT